MMDHCCSGSRRGIFAMDNLKTVGRIVFAGAMLALFFVISVNSAHASTWDEVNERLAACNAEAPPPGQSCSCYKNIILRENTFNDYRGGPQEV